MPRTYQQSKEDYTKKEFEALLNKLNNVSEEKKVEALKQYETFSGGLHKVLSVLNQYLAPIESFCEVYTCLIENPSFSEDLARIFDILSYWDLFSDKKHTSFICYLTQSGLVHSAKLLIAFDRLKHCKVDPKLDVEPYNLLIDHASNADSISLPFEALYQEEEKAPLPHNIFNSIIYRGADAEKIAKVFQLLRQCGATLDTSTDYKLFVHVLNKIPLLDNLLAAFNALKADGFNLKEHYAIYNTVANSIDSYSPIEALDILSNYQIDSSIKQRVYIDIISNHTSSEFIKDLFNILEENKININQDYDTVQTLIIFPCNMQYIRKVFSILSRRGLDFETYKILYEELIQSVSIVSASADKLEKLLAILEKTGADPKEDLTFYKLSINNLAFFDELAKNYSLMIRKSIAFKEHALIYEYVTQYPYEVDRCLAVFELCQSFGITSKHHAKLYETILQEKNQISFITDRFNCLRNFGYHLETFPSLYGYVIKGSHADSNFEDKLKALKYCGADPKNEKHLKLYELTITSDIDGEKLYQTIETLLEAQATLDNNLSLFISVLNRASLIQQINKAFQALIKAGATVADHQSLYELAIKHAYRSNDIAGILTLLSVSGANPTDHLSLYVNLFHFKHSVYPLIRMLSALMQCGADINKHYHLFELITKGTLFIDLTPTFKTLHSLDINLDTDPLLFETLIKQPAISDSILLVFPTLSRETGLKGRALSQYTPAIISSKIIVLVLLNHLSNTAPLSSLIIRVMDYLLLNNVTLPRLIKGLNEMDGYIQSHSPDLLEQSTQDTLFNILKHAFDHVIPTGPLNKGNGTRIYESILETIANTELSSIDADFSESTGYKLVINGKPYYINLLLREANLSHLNIEDSLIEKLINQLKNLCQLKMMPLHKNSFLNEESTHCLSDSLKLVLCQYFEEKYLNMNRLMRGEAFSDKQQYQWLTPTSGKENILANFICASLLNLALNRLSESVDTPHEEDSQTLDRGEHLSNEVIKRRLTNPVRSSCHTSFSAHPNGSPFFHKPGTKRTKLKGSTRFYIKVNSQEGEIIFAHATQFFYTEDKKEGNLIAEVICSPIYERNEGYYALLALHTAYERHLNRSYKDSPSDRQIGGVTISRPNHGLAHTYRVMLMTGFVIDYFARHANDNGLKRFCEFITDDERQYLQIAAAFSITGRESEISAGENLVRYDEFREASSEHLRQFLEMFPEAVTNPIIIERLLHIVRFMGNPTYEAPSNGIVQLNTHPDESERQLRNYYFCILSIAHKLDLPRCYTPEAFNRAMGYCLSKSMESTEQKADFNALVRYVIGLMKAHGNALTTDITDNNHLVQTNLGYEDEFCQASSSILKLMTLSEMVEKPALTEPLDTQAPSPSFQMASNG